MRTLFKKNRHKKEGSPNCLCFGKLLDLMMGGVITIKYSIPGRPVVNVQINNTLITQTLIYLGVFIHVMMCETKESLGLNGLRETPTLLQIANRSTRKLEGIMEDIVISIHLLEYLTNFMILQPKDSSGGYILILGRPWLATTDSYTDCRSRNMTISHGNYTKILILYPPSKPNIYFETPL